MIANLLAQADNLDLGDLAYSIVIILGIIGGALQGIFGKKKSEETSAESDSASPKVGFDPKQKRPSPPPPPPRDKRPSTERSGRSTAAPPVPPRERRRREARPAREASAGKPRPAAKAASVADKPIQNTAAAIARAVARRPAPTSEREAPLLPATPETLRPRSRRSSSAVWLRRRLREPASVREAVLLNELLAPPLALRNQPPN